MPRLAAVAAVVFHFRCDIKSDVNMPLFSIRSYINITYSVTANMFESLRNKLTAVSLLLVRVRLSLQDVGGPGLKRANEKRLILAHVIPLRASAPITHCRVPVRTHKHTVD